MRARASRALRLLTVAVLLGACSTSDPDSRTVAGQEGSVPAATDNTATDDTATGDTGTGDAGTTEDGGGTPVTFGPGAIQFVDPAANMEGLPAYQATLTVTFAGARDGVDEQWTQTEAFALGRDPMQAQFTSERVGAGAHVLQHVVVGGVAYDRDADGMCTATMVSGAADDTADEFAPRAEPVELLPAFVGGDDAGAETIGAVDTLHYTFDERALGLASPVTATGNVWVAANAGYVVRYSLVIDGASPYVGMSVPGHYTLDYELQPLDAAPVVAIPSGCPAGSVAVPPPADAVDVVHHPGTQTFTTPSALADVQSWYDSQLVPAGWIAVTAPLVAGETEMLTYERAGERLVVSMSRTGAVTSVIVLQTATG